MDKPEFRAFLDKLVAGLDSETAIDRLKTVAIRYFFVTPLAIEKPLGKIQHVLDRLTTDYIQSRIELYPGSVIFIVDGRQYLSEPGKSLTRQDIEDIAAVFKGPGIEEVYYSSSSVECKPLNRGEEVEVVAGMRFNTHVRFN